MGGCEGTCCMLTCCKTRARARIFGETAYPDQHGELVQPAAGIFCCIFEFQAVSPTSTWPRSMLCQFSLSTGKSADDVAIMTSRTVLARHFLFWHSLK